MWVNPWTRARSSSERTRGQWMKALCASAFPALKTYGLSATTCLLYCKNDSKMTVFEDEWIFSVAPNWVLLFWPAKIKHFPQCHLWDMMCLVWLWSLCLKTCFEWLPVYKWYFISYIFSWSVTQRDKMKTLRQCTPWPIKHICTEMQWQ